MIDVFIFQNKDIQKIYESCEIQKCFLYQNLTDRDSTSVFFIYISNLVQLMKKNPEIKFLSC